MPIVGAAILPHSPLLLPGLMPETRNLVAKSTVAATLVAQRLQQLQPDVLLVIVTHTETAGTSKGYALLQSPKLPYGFNELGDLVTNGTFTGAVGFTHHLKERLETRFPVPLVAVVTLPYTVAIPLVILGTTLNTKPLVCLQIPKRVSLDELNALATLLREALAEASERVVVVAAGDMAHATARTAVEAKHFDQLFQAACQGNSLEKLVNLDQTLRELTRECLTAPTCFLYRLLEGSRFATTVHSYEAPVGVGLLVADVSLG